MQVDVALDYINSIVYKPDWKVTATDHTNRFEGAVRVRIDYPAQNTNREEAKAGYQTDILTYATFSFVVVDCPDEVAIYRHLINKIIEIETHEAREYFRAGPALEAPFHPHRVVGMKRWGSMEQDLHFGLA